MNKEELQLKIQEITNYILNEKFDNFDEYENHQNNIINYFLEVASTIDDEQCAIFIKEMTLHPPERTKGQSARDPEDQKR